MKNAYGVTLKMVREKMGITLEEVNKWTAIDQKDLTAFEAGEDNISNNGFKYFSKIYASFLTLLGKENSFDFKEVEDEVYRDRYRKAKYSVIYNESLKSYTVTSTDAPEYGGKTFVITDFPSEEKAHGFIEGFEFGIK
ncbi:hypothetical protein ABET51_06635 [Metabacillus fastidiosus]|uniref:helix-turn-helix domain-containing protein n=1 Tax=Metabacillus fastidiosus TaxID=1458 RepID=UPI003D2B2283